MKLREALEYADELRQGNVFSENMKTRWVTEFEQMQQTEVLLLSEADLISYDFDKEPDAELLISPPYDKLYYLYLMAQIDLASGDWAEYNNTLSIFNKAYGDYMRRVAVRIDPAANAAEKNGYYVSAYAIAVKHGYTGTVEEWNAEHFGKKGDRGDRGADGVSPTAEVKTVDNGYEVTITDVGGAHIFMLSNGADGADGTNGVSPSVRVEPIANGHSVTITDANGSHSFDVFDGMDGTGAGDMTIADYDPENVVDAAGGIPAYVTAKIEEAFDGIANAEERAY